MIKRIVSLLLAVVITLPLISGCTTKDGSSDKENNEDVVNKTSGTAKEIDEIVMCENSDFSTGFSAASFHESKGFGYYISNVYETLVNYEDGKIVPGLAESWEMDDNGIVFKLRKNVKFSDGTVFDAQVVKKNFEMIPIILGPSIQTLPTLAKLKNIEVIDEYTVKLVMGQPYVGALQEFAAVHTHGIMSPNIFTDKGLSDEVGSKTFGTGPYVLDSFVKGQKYTFIRNDNYWGEVPDVKQFTVKIIPDMEARILALRAGEIDIVVGSNKITYDSFINFKEDSQFSTKVSKEDVYGRTLILNTTKEPFDDKNVRLALAYALNTQTICENVFYGIESVAKTHFSPQLPYCNVKFESTVYNVEKAKQLLDKAGYIDSDGDGIREKNGQKLEAELLYKTGLSINEDLSLVIAGQLKEVGFDINASGLDVMSWYVKACKGEGSILVYETMGKPFDPFTSIQTMSELTPNPDNVYISGLSQYSEINSKLIDLTNTMDKAYAQEIFDYVLTTIYEEAAYIPLSYMKELVIFSNKHIKDYKFNGQAKYIDVTGIVLN